MLEHSAPPRQDFVPPKRPSRYDDVARWSVGDELVRQSMAIVPQPGGC